MNTPRLSCLMALMLLQTAAQAQLAITEVLPVSRLNTNSGFHGAELWELTNFGTNAMNLHGYGYRDSDVDETIRRQPFTNLVLQAGESVIFFRIERDDQEVITPEDFRRWWGESKLPPNLQCRIYRRPGLSAWDGDEVWVLDPANNVVDTVQFERIRFGHTFTYDAQTGMFGATSEAGIHGAFTADLTQDIGSPGTTSGPVPVQFLQEPSDQAVDGGMTATFTVRASGVPRPSYQWFAHSNLIPGATTSKLVLANVQPSDAGTYRVVITNGLTVATSRTANLSVNTNPTAPGILSAPVDVTVFNGQTAVFNVAVRGYPPPTLRWQTNGVDVSNANAPTLELAGVTEAMSGIPVSIIISNAIGVITASARLTVTPRPQLRFTEVMPEPANLEDNRHFGWVELTNYDTNTVNLRGWRFSEEDSLEDALTITNDLILHPGESVVLAERLDQRLFTRWWGAGLPQVFNIYTYSGFGLNPAGGTFFLWNAAARDPDFEVVSTVSWAAATPGVSFECDTWCGPEGCASEAFLDSVLGVRGAFRAQDGGDIGSPGYVANPPVEILYLTQTVEGVALVCRVTTGRTYRLLMTPSLGSGWTPLQTQTATNNTLIFTDSLPGTQSFYRVQELP